jgi:hypothetical protein
VESLAALMRQPAATFPQNQTVFRPLRVHSPATVFASERQQVERGSNPAS